MGFKLNSLGLQENQWILLYASLHVFCTQLTDSGKRITKEKSIYRKGSNLK